MKTYRIILLVVFLIGIIYSCSEESKDVPNIPSIPETPVIPEEPSEEDNKMSYQEFCYKYCKGYHVNDTTKLKVYTFGNPNNEIEECLIGSYKDKLWLGVFDIKTKECIKEYIGGETLSSEVVYDKGYGEKDSINLYDSKIKNIFLKENSFSCALESKSTKMFVIFNDGLYKSYLSSAGGATSYLLLEWFDDTYLGSINTCNNIYTETGWTVFSKDGRILLSSDNYLPLDVGFFYLNYIDGYISTNYNEYVYASSTYGGIGLTKSSIDNSTGMSTILYETDQHPKFICRFDSVKNDSLNLSLDLTFLSGKNEHRKYRIDIHTWEFNEY